MKNEKNFEQDVARITAANLFSPKLRNYAYDIIHFLESQEYTDISAEWKHGHMRVQVMDEVVTYGITDHNQYCYLIVPKNIESTINRPFILLIGEDSTDAYDIIPEMPEIEDISIKHKMHGELLLSLYLPEGYQSKMPLKNLSWSSYIRCSMAEGGYHVGRVLNALDLFKLFPLYLST